MLAKTRHLCYDKYRFYQKGRIKYAIFFPYKRNVFPDFFCIQLCLDECIWSGLAGDLSFIQKSFFRNLIALLVALIMLFKERQPLHCDKKSAGALLLRATMGTVGIFCNFYAVDHLPISGRIHAE